MASARYGNWKYTNDTRTLKRWQHINHPNLRVDIRLNHDPKIKAKYVVFHNHPGQRGRVVEQPVDPADTMAEALVYAKKHMKHWDNPWLWASDPDFGKRGKRG